MKQYFSKISFFEKYGKKFPKTTVPKIFIAETIQFKNYDEFAHKLNIFYNEGFDFVKIIKKKDDEYKLEKEWVVLLKKMTIFITT